MKAVYQERDRLEALAKRLHSLSSGGAQDLVRMKEQRQELRAELERKEALHGESAPPPPKVLRTSLHKRTVRCILRADIALVTRRWLPGNRQSFPKVGYVLKIALMQPVSSPLVQAPPHQSVIFNMEIVF